MRPRHGAPLSAGSRQARRQVTKALAAFTHVNGFRAHKDADGDHYRRVPWEIWEIWEIAARRTSEGILTLPRPGGRSRAGGGERNFLLRRTACLVLRLRSAVGPCTDMTN